MRYLRFTATLAVLFLLNCLVVRASHIVGGGFTYAYMGDSAGLLKYQVTLTIYEDCLNGQPSAIEADNPAYLGVYSATAPFQWLRTDSCYFSSSETVPTNFSNTCVANVPHTCLLKKVFVMNYLFKPSASGYVITWARCCRNASVNNIVDPANNGSTFYCVIPPYPLTNTSAVFKNFPPQIICLNNPLVYDNSATDANGDSLAYGFTASLNGATGANSKPLPGTGSTPPNSFPTGPPFDSTIYLTPYNSQKPMPGFPAIQIDPTTGLITGTPNLVGRYLVTVYCDEYSDGLFKNRVTREFQFVVTPCTKTVVANIPQYSTDPNTYIIDCENYTVHFVNTSTGGFSYKWTFGTGNPGDTSSAFEPMFTYPDTGTYTVKLIVNPGSTCPDSISRFVKVYPKFRADFTDTGGQCPGKTLSFIDQSSSSIKPINYWKWAFGDGDSTYDENPSHIYKLGGVYNVILISQNARDCADTIMKQIVIDNFGPFAGNDTTIVKGESIQFDATGGTSYAWSPSTNLNDTSIYNPTGYFPDTGIYIYSIFASSAYGCKGYDTIKVSVVNQAAFVVPSAFTPNGDGLNDYFRAMAVGYRNLNYFRVYNRWGEQVFNTTSLETGWDGNYRSRKAEMGTYFWEISFTDRFGKTGTMKGDVELIR